MSDESFRILWAVHAEPGDAFGGVPYEIARVHGSDAVRTALADAHDGGCNYALCWLDWEDVKDRAVLASFAAQCPRAVFVLEGAHDALPDLADLPPALAQRRILDLETPVTPAMRRSVARHVLRDTINARKVAEEAQETTETPPPISRFAGDRMRLEMIYHTMERIHAARNFNEAIATTLIEMANFVEARTGSFMMIENGEILRVVEAIGPNSDRIIGHQFSLAESRIAKHAIDSGEPVLVTDMQNDARFQESSDEKRYRSRSVLSVPVSARHRPLGVINLGSDSHAVAFDETDRDFVVTLARQIAIALEKDTLMGHLRLAVSGSIRALAGAIEAKDPYTRGHSERVTHFCVLTAIEMGMSPADVEILKQAAILHDIGKIGIPGEVLNKNGRLDAMEFRVIQRHPDIGIQIVRQIGAMDATLPIIRAHHERMDGRGYPNRLAGGEIPLGARILAVVDAFDAMTSDRPYRKGLPLTIAVEELRRCAGSQFDTKVTEVFISHIDSWPKSDPEEDPMVSVF